MDLYLLINKEEVCIREIMILIFIEKNKIKLNLDKKMELLEPRELLKEKVFKDILESLILI